MNTDRDTDTDTSGLPDEALLDRIRTNVRHADELATFLAQRGTKIAAVAAPGETTLTDLAAAARSVADMARATSQAILLLLTPEEGTSAAPSTASEISARMRRGDDWAATLDLQLKTAVRIHALICAELSDRAAIAEEWNADPNAQPPSPPGGARVLAEHARMLRDSVSS